MQKRIAWPSRYRWLHEYLVRKPDAELEYKESWDALLYRLHGKIFALLLRNKTDGTLLNLKCDPYLSLMFREKHPAVLPGWHMNKLHWISLALRGKTPEAVCRELVDSSYAWVLDKLPGYYKHPSSVPPPGGKVPIP
ncbi:MAG: MmcQ/YjbR family DNA-binding protein [Deltaproteobacteria bacterium]|nr:MmcQ/YjbR family DNA-binding protein [Deltaproteobacteria bacterium]